MIRHTSTSVVFIGLPQLLAGTLEAWVRAHLVEPLDVISVHTVPDALAHLRSHRIDLVFADDTAARHELRTLHAVSPATAVIGVAMKPDEAALLHLLRQGAHEVLCLLPSAGADQVHVLQRALARVNGRADMLKTAEPLGGIETPPRRLIHDLNNLLTSINGFADLLLAQLTPDHPARTGAEQIRLAGKRATALLKAQSPSAPAAPPPQPQSPASSAIQRSISRIQDACQAPPLAPPEYRLLFEVMASEINENDLIGSQTLTNVVARAQERGLDVGKDDVRFILEVVSEPDPWFEQGASANLFAGRFRNFVVARCRGQGLNLSADELDLIDAWFAGGAASPPQPVRTQQPAMDPQAAGPGGMDDFPRIVRTRL